MAAPFFIVLCVSVLSLLANAHCISTLNYSSDDLLSEARLTNLFDTWVTRHGKSYANGEMEERQKRYQIFKSNLRFIEAHNRKDSTYKLGLNRFADLTNDEFRVQFLGSKGEVARKRLRNGVRHANVEDLKSHISLPASFDWRKEGVVTPVKDQGRCGSCWAFSSIGAIEGINAIVTGKLVSLSEQELVSCDVGGVNAGCDGGYMDDAFQWVIDHGGISSEDGYPYTSGDGKDGFCNLKLSAEKAVTIDGYVDVTPNSDEALWDAVAQQPVTVAIDGSALAFQLYSSGVFTGSCSDNPDDTDHAVLVVGWGSENGLRYWIVKNSWDSTWGMDGYIHMVRNDDPYGICAINSAPSYPTKTAGFTGRLAEA